MNKLNFEKWDKKKNKWVEIDTKPASPEPKIGYLIEHHKLSTDQLESLLLEFYKKPHQYQIQYVDNEPAWTIPALLTKKRIQSIITDASIKLIKII